jgi:signal transduction histidine kinase
LSEKLSKEQCKEIMTKIHSISLNANYLARNLLEWAYVSRKGLQPVYKKIDLNQVITSEIELYKIISEQKQITIRFNVNKSLVLDTDENMFRIIIRNLLNNAVKFSTPQSTIIIETNRKGENLEIRIRDKGVGIDAKILEKLNNHAPDHQLIANGMGLYLTKTYVNLLGGDLAFESTKDIGATAILTFRLLV